MARDEYNRGDSRTLSPLGHGLLWPAIALAFAGWIIELAGLAGIQKSCSAAWFGQNADAKLTASLPLQLGCGNALRFLWFILWLAFFTLLVLAALAATGHARPGGWLSMVGLTAVAVTLQIYLTDRAFNLLSSAYNAPPGVGPVLSRARAFFAGAIIKTAALLLALLAIGPAVETARDAEDEEGGAYGKRRRAGGAGYGGGGPATGATGRVAGGPGGAAGAGTTPLSSATVPAATRAHPQPTQPVAVV